MEARKVTYRLAVFQPDSTVDDLFLVESQTPFGSMTEGDLFLMDSIEGFAESLVSGRIGRIVHTFTGVTKDSLVHLTQVYLKSDDWHKEGNVHRSAKV